MKKADPTIIAIGQAFNNYEIVEQLKEELKVLKNYRPLVRGTPMNEQSLIKHSNDSKIEVLEKVLRRKK